jgi:hypothetical protein
MNRVQALCYAVQDEDSHRAFHPYGCYFLASLGEKDEPEKDGSRTSPRKKEKVTTAEEQRPDAIHLCDVIDVSKEQMRKHFGRSYYNKTCSPFHLLESRPWGKHKFVAVKMLNEWSTYGSPNTTPKDKGAIVSQSLHLLAVKRLKVHINNVSKVMLTRFIEFLKENTKTLDLLLNLKPLDVLPSPSTSPPTPPSTSQSTAAPVITQVVSPLQEREQVVSPPLQETEQVVVSPLQEMEQGFLPRILSYVQELRKKATSYENPESHMLIGHIAYELIAMLRKGKDSVYLGPKNARGSTWTREAVSCGESARTIRRNAQTVRATIKTVTKRKSQAVKNKILSRSVLRYQRYQRRIVIGNDDYMTLQQAGGMTDNRMLIFGKEFARITAVYWHDKEKTLSKMTEGLVPDFSLESMKVRVKSQEVERYAFQVDHLVDVINQRIVSLCESGLLVKSSSTTLLDDKTLIIRFGGDKGGNFMQFKFGATCMNCPDPNSPDAFDICATLDAPDTYNNIKALFEKITPELEFYFDLEQPPSMAMVVHDGKVLCDIAYNVGDNNSCKTSMKEMFENVAMVELPMDSNATSKGVHTGGPFTFHSSSIVEILTEEGLAWGLRFLDVDEEDRHTVRFRSAVPISKVNLLKIIDYKLHTCLGGDIEFLGMVLGVQGSSATFPCYFCEVTKKILEKRSFTMDGIPRRSKKRMEVQFAKVKMKTTTKKRKEEAKKNGSVLREPLIPVDVSRVLLSPLHIILGITKKIWDELILEIQNVDGAESNRCALDEIRDLITGQVAFLEAETKRDEENLERAVKEKKKAWESLSAARSSTSATFQDEVDCREQHAEKCKTEKEIRLEMASRDKTLLSSLKNLVKDLNSYLKMKRGTFEHALEELLKESPFKVRHNPFYGGAFNGNDCFRLVTNYSLMFLRLRETSERETQCESEIGEICSRYEDIFGAFSEIIPLLRSSRLLSPLERSSLLSSIAAFYDAYVQKCKGTITIKMHHLVHHLKEVLANYGTIGLFTEDAMESIHAIVNELARRYSSLDYTRRAKQTVRVLASRKKNNVTQRKVKKEKAEKKGGCGCEPPKKKTRRQGESKVPIANNKKSMDIQNTISAAVTSFQSWKKDQVAEESEQGEEESRQEGFITFEGLALSVCEKCQADEEDRLIPTIFLPLHDLIVHLESGNRFEK